MRNKIFCSIIIFYSSLAFGGDYSKNLVVFNVGLSQPTESFASKKFKYDAGFANIGTNIELEYFRYVARFFALNASVGHALFRFDESNFLNEYKRVLSKQDGINAETGNYHLLKGVVGLVLKTPILEKFDILLIAQLGYNMAFHPEILVTDEEFGAINSLKSSNDVALTASYKLKMNYFITKKTGISISWGNYFTNPKFTGETNRYNTFYLPINYYTYTVGYSIFF